MEELILHQRQQVSLIDGLDIGTVQQTMQKIATFQSIVQQALKKDHDYGVIPGTQKPTLLKPGGEKICMVLGISPVYDFLDKTVDHQKGFFNYEVKCTLMQRDQQVAQGVGSCNNYEKKYRWINSDTIPPGTDPTALESFTDKYGHKKYKIPNPNACDLANTILKMAKKRAFVDAVLQVSSLSEIFTQDLEDMRDLIEQEQSVAAATMTPEEAGQVKCPFGKHKGKILKDIYRDDRQYFDWLISNATDQIIKKACEIMQNAVKNKHSGAEQAKPVNAKDNEIPLDIPEDEEDPFK